MPIQIQIRRDTAANWTSNDPTLASGELGFETDTGSLKIGDGSTAWTSLAYFNPSSNSFPVTDTTEIIQGSADTTKRIRFEVDGLTTSTTRVITPPDADITLDDAGDSRPPSGAAGGDLGGTYPNPTVDHTVIDNIGTNSHAQIDTHIADTANPHATDVGNLGSGTLAELNAAVTDASLGPGRTLDARGARYYDSSNGLRIYDTAGTSITANFAIVVPIHFSIATDIDRIGLMLNNATAGATVRLGIYENSGGLPGALVVDAGTVSAAAAGAQEITINETLPAGWSWLCFQSDNSSISAAGFTSGTGHGDLGNADIPTVTAVSTIYQSNTGALPDPWGASVTYFTGNAVIIKVRQG